MGDLGPELDGFFGLALSLPSSLFAPVVRPIAASRWPFIASAAFGYAASFFVAKKVTSADEMSAMPAAAFLSVLIGSAIVPRPSLPSPPARLGW